MSACCNSGSRKSLIRGTRIRLQMRTFLNIDCVIEDSSITEPFAGILCLQALQAHLDPCRGEAAPARGTVDLNTVQPTSAFKYAPLDWWLFCRAEKFNLTDKQLACNCVLILNLIFGLGLYMKHMIAWEPVTHSIQSPSERSRITPNCWVPEWPFCFTAVYNYAALFQNS